MKRSAPLRRKKRINPYNAVRRARRRLEAFGPQAAYCRTQPCCVCLAPPPSDPAHVRSRGAGGKDSDCVSLCRFCHTQQHQLGIKTFQERCQVDLAAVARRIAKELR